MLDFGYVVAVVRGDYGDGLAIWRDKYIEGRPRLPVWIRRVCARTISIDCIRGWGHFVLQHGMAVDADGHEVLPCAVTIKRMKSGISPLRRLGHPECRGKNRSLSCPHIPAFESFKGAGWLVRLFIGISVCGGEGSYGNNQT